MESAEPREVHHFATLLGYGACAINPYLAHETIGQLIDEGLLDKDYYAAVQDYDNAILNGIVKIASKMGISTIQSYQSSQIFEAVGISKDVIDKYFTGTVSRVGGISMADIQADVEALHNAAFDPLGLDINMELADSGAHKFRSGKEEHLFKPPDHPPVPESLPHRRLRHLQAVYPDGGQHGCRGCASAQSAGFQLRRRRRHPAGGGRAGLQHRQAVQGRCHELRRTER